MGKYSLTFCVKLRGMVDACNVSRGEGVCVCVAMVATVTADLRSRRCVLVVGGTGVVVSTTSGKNMFVCKLLYFHLCV